MGNSLSPLVSEAFMCKLESDLHSEGLLPKIWLRYVDDVFAVVKKEEVQKILDILNSRYDSVKFTFELPDNNNILPFLDVSVQQVDHKLKFNVFRKPTTTKRYITSDSYCSHQNKIAAFHSMVYRMCRLPLSHSDFKAEYENIVDIARTNGFGQALVDKLVHKHSRNLKNQQYSTLFSQNQRITADAERKVFASVCYAPKITNHLTKSFQRANMKLVYSNNNKLSSTLGCTKDVIPNKLRSGIYQINCSDCDHKYIGQTRRALHTRVTEHLRSIKNKDVQKAIPAHIFDPDHNFKHNINSFDNNVKLIKTVYNSKKLDAYESIFIATNHNLMNLEKGPIESPLFKFL